MAKCRIQWVDSAGNATPDENPAVARVYRKAYVSEGWAVGSIRFDETEHYPICANHLRELDNPGMDHWVKEEL